MKCFLLILLVVVVPVLSIAAQPQSTPLNTHIQRTPMDKLTIRLRQQNIQIQRDLKAGKLTKDQAKTLKAQVETIRNAEIADLKQNGTKTLTDAQIASLNQQLNTLSKSIPIK